LLARARCDTGGKILALKHYFARHLSTVIMLDDLTSKETGRCTASRIASFISISAPLYGGERRRLRVMS
jgi:circadian clock protein KaiC